QKSSYENHFESIVGEYFGRTDHNFRFHYHQTLGNPPLDALSATFHPVIETRTCENIWFIRAYKSMSYQYYLFQSKRPRAIIHELHPLLLIETEDMDNLARFSELCARQRIPLYFGSLVYDPDFIQKVKSFVGPTSIFISDMTIACIYVKLMLGYENGTAGELLSQDIFLEHY
ncbi:MAG: hypothetical protein AAGU32_06275, partial [Bacillota bacterium]